MPPDARIGFIASDNGGGGRVRSFWPAEALRRRGWSVVWAAPAWPPEVGGVDLLFVHRPLAPDTLRRIKDWQASGTTVIVDEDDDLSSVPHRRFLDDPAWPYMVRRHDEAVQQADGLIVTTDRLLALYGPMAQRAWLVPNYLPRLSMLRWTWSARRTRSCYVGWAGTTDVHEPDLRWLAPAADRAFAGATFTTVGDPKTPRLLGLTTTPVEWWPYQHDWQSLYRLMSKADVGIVPLHPGLPFNLAKSWLKAAEYMALGRPVVATHLPEQAKLIDDGSNGFLASTPDEFAVRVQELVADANLRAEMGRAALETSERFALDSNVHVWETVVLEALAARRKRATILA